MKKYHNIRINVPGILSIEGKDLANTTIITTYSDRKEVIRFKNGSPFKGIVFENDCAGTISLPYFEALSNDNFTKLANDFLYSDLDAKEVWLAENDNQS